MKVTVERVANVKKADGGYVIGHLYVDGVYVCDTIEDLDRGLDDALTISENKKRKVFGKTCIPTGTYTLTLNIVSPTFWKKQYYQKYCYGKLPRLLNVKAFDGILIHRGKDEYSSEGCVIVGYNKVKGQVVDSQKAFETLYSKLKGHDNITITITRKYKV